MDHGKMGKAHLWLMVLCCLIPLLALGAIFVLNIPVPQVLLYALVLLCPLSHVAMMAFMGRGGHGHGEPADGTGRLPGGGEGESSTAWR